MNKLYALCCTVVAGVILYGMYVINYMLIDNGLLPKLGLSDVKTSAQIWLVFNLIVMVGTCGLILACIYCVTYFKKFRTQPEISELNFIV
ncbi:Hypothetical protein PACV_252 [Pacmanvirus A23]|uniref:Hypothetical protein n=1 Tax=Pacmanvirus A23 TaxID=1932881 RepID=UPI000A0931F0|nr:Hypothetical protein B9W72_gp250 [Pacmanvirus A23]SIP85967.1 Hypothetical protein PACV_252 [Pacmanvirus A23]